MIKIKITKIIFGIILLLAFAGAASAKVNDLCVGAQDQSQFDVSTDWNCFDITSDESSVNITTLLQESGFAYSFNSNGTLCSINSFGSCPNDVISIYIANSNWEITKDLSKKIDDNDIVVFVYGNKGIESGSEPEMLKIKKITGIVNGKKNTLDIEDDDSFTAKPGDKVDIKIDFKNEYDSKTKRSIRDVKVTGTISSIEDGDDIEETPDEFSIDAGKSKTATISFVVPFLVDDEDYDIKIEITSEDEEGIAYEPTLENLKLTVDKKSHDLAFKKLEFSKESIQCGGEMTLSIDVVNTGSNDESVEVSAINKGFGIDFKDKVELQSGSDEDAEYQKSISFNVEKDTEAGIYPIQVKAASGSVSISKTVDLKAEKCEAAKEEIVKEDIKETESKGEEEIVVQKKEEAPPTEIITPPAATETAKASFYDSNTFIAVVVGAEILAVLIGIIIVIRIFKK